MRRATTAFFDDTTGKPFQSTLSVRRATPLEDEDIRPRLFQSTLSVRRATWRNQYPRLPPYISIHALREESDHAGDEADDREQISIHALREESDHPSRIIKRGLHISIHALREESDMIRPPYRE